MIRYIKDAYEATTDAIWYESPHYDAVRSDFDSIQHSVI